MKVICDRGALLETLNIVSGAVVSRTPKPVLTCVKLSADDSSLTLSATDREVSVQVSTPRVEVSEGGEALIPADKLSQITRESLDPTLTIESDKEAVHIRGQDAHFKVFGYAPTEFPGVPTFDGNPDFEMTERELGQLIHRTLYATARENSRYAINGVLVEREKNKIHVVATDGHRLALARGDCQSGEAETNSAIVPTKALNMLQKLLGDEDNMVRVKVADNQILFATGDAVIASNLVEGNFPPYKDVVPKDGDKKATLGTDVLISAFRRAALLTNEESKGVKMSFNGEAGAGGLKLMSRAPEMGEAEIDVECGEYDGESIDIGFNPAYVLDALKVIETDKIQLDMKAPNKPGVIRTGPNFTYVIMPVNLQ